MNYLSLFLCCLLAAITTRAQVVLEKKYTSIYSDWFFTVKLERDGVKYGLISPKAESNRTSYTISLYNEDHSIFKTFTTPSFHTTWPTSFYNFSNTLFNTNEDDIEYMITYSTTDTSGGKSTTTNYVEVLTDNKESLLKIDSAGIFPSFYFRVYQPNYTILNILKFETTCKLLLLSAKVRDGSRHTPSLPSSYVPMIYSLPGCSPVITSFRSSQEIDAQSAYLSSPIPNPSSDYTVVNFELPQNEKIGELTVYNTAGLRMKSYKVDGTFGNLLLNNHDLAPGTYYYTLTAGARNVKGHTMVVIK